MKIQSSNIAMQSTREYESFSTKKVAILETRADDAAAILELSAKNPDKDIVTNIKDYEKEKEAETKKQSGEALAKHMANLIQKNNKVQEQDIPKVKEPEDLMIECLKRLVEALNKHRERKGLSKIDVENVVPKTAKPQQSFGFGISASSSVSFSMSSVAISSQGATSGLNQWVRTTATSVFMTELENTTFNTVGNVTTADGRNIEFGISVEMSRAFCAKYDSISQEEIIFTDPLVFNMDSNVDNISDQKFLFDLDCDGEEEEISRTTMGSGFLALDKNGDGKINDGSELFGTKSGNGFKDLAEYDSDGNGWIDENDDVYEDLQVWTKDEYGNDKLLNLKEADVGAIYLGYADTEFTLNNNETNGVNGVVRGTGIFLKESGGVGTVQHIDLAL